MMCGPLKDRAEAKLSSTMLGELCVEVNLYGCGSGPGLLGNLTVEAATELYRTLGNALLEADANGG